MAPLNPAMKTPNLTHILFTLSLLLHTASFSLSATTQKRLLIGFSATPDSSISSFQPLLTDPTSIFSLGFLPLNKSHLTLSILHNPSSEPVWFANTTISFHSRLLFNGSLVLSEPQKGLVWSTHTNGDHLLLLNTSNLQIQTLSSSSVLWQSFDFPSNTLVENQNFTSKMSLFSSNGIFSMKLGDDFFGLYTNFNQDLSQIYLRHSAMEAKAQIIDGKGPIYARISSNGFLGMYQTGQEPAPIDVLPFDSFQRPISGLRRLRLETDGNLKAYYWDGSNWVLDYTAIQDKCELPSSCGSYGVCRPGNSCSCLDEKTEYKSGECFPPESGDFCQDTRDDYWVLRRTGVELPYKEMMGFEKMETLNECEDACESNCSCWGAVFNNASGYCYKLDFPISSMVEVEDERKIGYFKVRRAKEKKRNFGYVIGVVLLVVVCLLLGSVAGFGGYRFWRRKTSKRRFMEDEMSPGPYRDLGSASFRSIELVKS